MTMSEVMKSARALVCVLALWGCDSTPVTPDGGPLPVDDAGPAPADAGPSPTDAGPTTGRTLENCATNIAADVPEFYSRYFRCVDISMSGTDVVIHTTDQPPTPSYYYGVGHENYVAWDDRGGAYMANPNQIATQNITITIPADPTPKGLVIDAGMVDLTMMTDGEEYRGGPQGVALNSAALFNAMAAPGDDINDEQWTFDPYLGHPTRDGTYHHHSVAPGPLEVLVSIGVATTSTPEAAEIELYGIMCDGTLVLGCTELDGTTPSSGDFDAQGGHAHDIVDEGGTTHFTGRYHTHICPGTYSHAFTPEIQYYQTCGVTL